jgi:3-mercaptopyruvate sulfurtransferase SseA
VAQQLRDRGFTQAYALQGGFDAWQEAGGQVEPKTPENSPGSRDQYAFQRR